VFEESRAPKGHRRKLHYPMPKKVRPLHEGIVKVSHQHGSNNDKHRNRADSSSKTPQLRQF